VTQTLRGCVLVIVLGALTACVQRPAPVDELGALPEAGLYQQMRWVNRGPDAAFEATTREAYIDAVREEILARRTDWTEEAAEAIRDGRVELGMTMPQVTASIGLPIEYPWWDAQRRPIGVWGDDLAYKNALADRNRWTYRYADDYLKVWFRDGAVYRIMDDRTGRVESAD